MDGEKVKKCIYCDGDIKISKRGNKYCSNICWEKEPYKSQREEKIKELNEESAYYDFENFGDRD
jgi:heterodisulfide reductase subunit A-like polyferredoxin